MITDRTQVRKYFKKFPGWAVWVLLLLGLPSLLITVSTMGGKQSGSFTLFSLFWTIVWCALGGWALISYYEKPSDADMDVLIQQDLKGLEERAITKAGLDRSELVSESVAVYGPRFWNIGGAEVGIKRGDDGIVRFMPIGVTIINFTAHQLSAYQCALDLMTGNPLSESTDEYFYKDVVSVSTQSETLTLGGIDSAVLSKGPLGALMVAGKLQLNEAETFTLTTSGATKISVVLRDTRLIQRAGGGTIPTDIADKAVATVRKMLREKKIAAASA
ncbi:MAG TPA: hypothetical protein VE398_20245 [Acidobacteriota bacterium]|nr:hypothetical protein [Acidobacteriota bacterium]